MKQKSYYLKIFLIIECVLLIFLGIFYFSAGRTLYERDSDGNVAEFNATNDVGELTQGVTVEQVYTSQMDLLDSIGVMVSDYGKSINHGVEIQCENLSKGQVIAKKTFSADEFGVNQYVYLNIADGVKVDRGDQIKISCTSDGEAGDAPTVLYNVENKLENPDVARDAQFTVNGNVVPGTMCIAASGRNYVWTGPNYWKLVLLAVALVAVLYGIECSRDKRGKTTVLFNMLFVLKKYKFLIKQLVKRDFKVRYKRSVLGVFWSFLNPLLMMIVQYVVFSQLFKSDIENYPVYLLSGTVIFNFFNEAINMGMTSITSNAALIKKVYMPKYIYPVSRVFSSLINLGTSLIPLLAVMLLTRIWPKWSLLLLVFDILCLVVFVMGMSLILSTCMTFFQDTLFLWGVVSMIWMYLTPIFYMDTIIPEKFLALYHMNPMYQYINFARICIIDGVSPNPISYLWCILTAVVVFAIGVSVFRKNQNRFVLYL